MHINYVSKINHERALLWHKNGIEEWSVADWAVAMAGEAGEICDAVKKLRRVEMGIQSKNKNSPISADAAIAAVAQEIGDTFIYLDLLAQRLGIDIEQAIMDTFNRVSEREGFPQRLSHIPPYRG